MINRFTEGAREVVALARKEAQSFHHEVLGTEHILLGLMRAETGVASRALRNLGADPERARKAIEAKVPSGRSSGTKDPLPFGPQTTKLFELASEEAAAQGHESVDSEHLLLSLLREKVSTAAQLLADMNLSPENVLTEVGRLASRGEDPASERTGKPEEGPMETGSEESSRSEAPGAGQPNGSSGNDSVRWGDTTDAKIGQELLALRERFEAGRYCPKCRREYDWGQDVCGEDGTPLRDRSIFGTRFFDGIFDAKTFGTVFERLCPRCGASFDVGMSHCPDDGVTLKLSKRSGRAVAEPDPKEWIGKTLGGKWRVTEFMADGGFGCVYKAEGIGLGQPVAVKRLKISLYRDLFLAEATILSGLDNPRVVRVIDYGEEDETPYLVMQFVTGTPLHELLRADGLTLQEKAEIMRQVALALAEARDAQSGNPVVHLDLKPEHIFVRRQEQELHTTVIDFGIAKILTAADEGGDAPERRASVVGTPPYMAPERFRGVVDHRSDIYSFGVVFYELLAGRKPFAAASIQEYESLHRNEPPPPLRRDAAGQKIPSPLRRLVDTSLAKRVEDRPQSAAELAREIQSWLARTRLGRAALWAAAILVVLSIAVGAYLYVWPPGVEVRLTELNGPGGAEHHVSHSAGDGDEGALVPALGAVTGFSSGRAVLECGGRAVAEADIVGGRIRLVPRGLDAGEHSARITARSGLQRASSGPFPLVVDQQPPSITIDVSPPNLQRKKGGFTVVDEKAVLTVRAQDDSGRIKSLIYKPEGGESRTLPMGEGITARELIAGASGNPVPVVFEARDWAGYPETGRVRVSRRPKLLTLLPDRDTPGDFDEDRNIVKVIRTNQKHVVLKCVFDHQPQSLSVSGGLLAPVDGGVEFSLPISGLQDGVNKLTLVATDFLGKPHPQAEFDVDVRLSSEEIQVTLDGSEDEIVIEYGDPALSEVKVTVIIRIDGKGRARFEEVDGLQIAPEPGRRRIRLDQLKNDGRYQIEFRGIDKYGNVHSQKWPDVSVDRTKPQIDDPGIDSEGVGTSGSPVPQFPEDTDEVRFSAKVWDLTDTKVHLLIGGQEFPMEPDKQSTGICTKVIPAKDLLPLLKAYKNEVRLVAEDHANSKALAFPRKAQKTERTFFIYADEALPDDRTTKIVRDQHGNEYEMMLILATGWYDDVHDRWVKNDFFVLTRPVSQREFASFALAKGITGVKFDPESAEPVRGVNRSDARGFCSWLGNGFWLPTVAECKFMLRDKKLKQDIKALNIGQVLEWTDDGDERNGILLGSSHIMDPKWIQKAKTSRDWPASDRGTDFGFRFIISFTDWQKLNGDRK